MKLTSIMQPAAMSAIAIAATFGFLISEVRAQEPKIIEPNPVKAVPSALEQIKLTMGKGGVFQTTAPYAKISVTDEKIVEVTPQSDREFVFNPKGIGTTNVFVFDQQNKLIVKLDVNVVANVTTEVPEQTSEETSGKVKVYNRIYNAQGELVKPALYRCNSKNCDNVKEARTRVQSQLELRRRVPQEAQRLTIPTRSELAFLSDDAIGQRPSSLQPAKRRRQMDTAPTAHEAHV
jgi:Pilus formation protein N terminal region